MSDEDTAPASTKADAEAEKASKKADRPWWRQPIWLIVIGIAALGLLSGLIGESGEPASDEQAETSDTDTSDDAADDSGNDDEGEQRAAVGEPAVDGQFTFTVTDPLDCGHDTIGEEGLEEDAQGQWCILTAEVENTGDEARSLSASAQLLYDTEGREFQASSPMGVDSPVYEQINPGNSVEGDFFFDVPDGFEAAYAELHDSALSGGVQVDLAE